MSYWANPQVTSSIWEEKYKIGNPPHIGCYSYNLSEYQKAIANYSRSLKAMGTCAGRASIARRNPLNDPWAIILLSKGLGKHETQKLNNELSQKVQYLEIVMPYKEYFDALCEKDDLISQTFRDFLWNQAVHLTDNGKNKSTVEVLFHVWEKIDWPKHERVLESRHRPEKYFDVQIELKEFTEKYITEILKLKREYPLLMEDPDIVEKLVAQFNTESDINFDNLEIEKGAQDHPPIILKDYKAVLDCATKEFPEDFKNLKPTFSNFNEMYLAVKRYESCGLDMEKALKVALKISNFKFSSLKYADMVNAEGKITPAIKILVKYRYKIEMDDTPKWKNFLKFERKELNELGIEEFAPDEFLSIFNKRDRKNRLVEEFLSLEENKQEVFITKFTTENPFFSFLGDKLIELNRLKQEPAEVTTDAMKVPYELIDEVTFPPLDKVPIKELSKLKKEFQKIYEGKDFFGPNSAITDPNDENSNYIFTNLLAKKPDDNSSISNHQAKLEIGILPKIKYLITNMPKLSAEQKQTIVAASPPYRACDERQVALIEGMYKQVYLFLNPVDSTKQVQGKKDGLEGIGFVQKEVGKCYAAVVEELCRGIIKKQLAVDLEDNVDAMGVHYERVLNVFKKELLGESVTEEDKNDKYFDQYLLDVLKKEFQNKVASGELLEKIRQRLIRNSEFKEKIKASKAYTTFRDGLSEDSEVEKDPTWAQIRLLWNPEDNFCSGLCIDPDFPIKLYISKMVNAKTVELMSKLV